MPRARIHEDDNARRAAYRERKLAEGVHYQKVALSPQAQKALQRLRAMPGPEVSDSTLINLAIREMAARYKGRA